MVSDGEKGNSSLILITLDTVSCIGEMNLLSLSIREVFAATKCLNLRKGTLLLELFEPITSKLKIDCMCS